MRNIYIILLSFSLISVKGQVGINTTTPQKTLDVNGTLYVRQEIRTGGTSVVTGAPGAAGQLFGVQDGLSDTWKTVQIADGTGSLSLFYLNTTKDITGIQFIQTGTTGSYNLNSAFTTSPATPNWVYMEGTTDNFNVTKNDNLSKAVLSFQTTVQITRGAGQNWTTGSASYACGIFLSRNSGQFELKAVRNDVVKGVAGTYKIFNLNVTLDALQLGSYQVKAACTNRNLGTSGAGTLTTLGIGRAVDATTLNSNMSQSIMTTSVLQTY
ncbi:hypothetical protein CHRY9390_02020 [Chryseobacterium aquaeductus]|uniref:Uncharacterized protein n=1 Tax=Chryseobacterium aquaeductus TaxID=2675056 RepID=A0A9N8MGF5_9FLAO|nr:hypothetical protein [Chryseobacterium aquaeductus]CAA7331321.1 hypothetical protein CHRY9390_02020 [Chryseobacterium potabilaquae]CAD7809504.1 hypothetical protein CHRY9390_02020 [Chryseobacterium aquaeductus]